MCVCVFVVITKVTSYGSCVSQARGSPTFITAFVQMAVPFLLSCGGNGGREGKKAAAGAVHGLPGQGRYSSIVSYAIDYGIVLWFIQFLFLCLSLSLLG